MVVNGLRLLSAEPIKGMLIQKEKAHGVSHGLGEAGYDIRIRQAIRFAENPWGKRIVEVQCATTGYDCRKGSFALASAMEEFQMPDDLVGIVHDKSTWARRGLSVFNTVIEPGWNGFLTLELVYHGNDELSIPAGAGIAQVIFHQLAEHRGYTGKYANQPNRPVGPIESV